MKHSDKLLLMEAMKELAGDDDRDYLVRVERLSRDAGCCVIYFTDVSCQQKGGAEITNKDLSY